MKLDPYVKVDDVPFSASTDDIVRTCGAPTRDSRNDVGLRELDYEAVVYRFQDCGRLEEVTVQARVLELGTVAVPFATLASFVREHDPSAFERAGFLVSPRYGLAFDPRDACWVTALARHSIDLWRAL